MKPFVRPPLVITTEPTKHNFYATFDPNTGKVTGMTPQKQGNCVEIDEYLANQIQKGNKMRIFVLICIIILTVSGCGKKSEPQYQGKLNHIQIVL